eukprot:2416025-Rhodomonas_salina.2
MDWAVPSARYFHAFPLSFQRSHRTCLMMLDRSTKMSCTTGNAADSHRRGGSDTVIHKGNVLAEGKPLSEYKVEEGNVSSSTAFAIFLLLPVLSRSVCHFPLPHARSRSFFSPLLASRLLPFSPDARRACRRLS